MSNLLGRYFQRERFHKQVNMAASLAFKVLLQFGDCGYRKVMQYLDNYANLSKYPPEGITMERFAAMVVQAPSINLFEE